MTLDRVRRRATRTLALLASLVVLSSLVVVAPVSADPTTCASRTYTVNYRVVHRPTDDLLGTGSVKMTAKYCFNSASVWADGSNQPSASVGPLSLYPPSLFRRGYASATGVKVFFAEWRWVFTGSIFPVRCDAALVPTITVDKFGVVRVGKSSTVVVVTGAPCSTVSMTFY